MNWKILIECGEGNFYETTENVNGSETTPHKYPWMAAMFIDNFNKHNLLCAGSVISTKHILTSGEKAIEK